MRTQEYILQGKEVPAKFRGTKVALRVPETHAEAVQLCGGDESAANGLFTDAWVIYMQGRLRRASGKEGATAESLAQAAATLTYQRAAAGTPKTAKPKTVVKRQAENAGNKIFERMLADASYRQRAIENGFVEQETFDAWVAARKAAEAQPSGNGATQAAKPEPAKQPEVARRPAGAGGGKR